MKKTLNFETLQLHAGQEAPDPATGARAVPIYQTSSFVFDNCDHASSLFDLTGEGFIYSRINNPTTDIFEKRMTALEGGVGALGLASGAAAVSYSLLNILSKGDRIISSRNIYGGTYNLFAHTFQDYGIETDFVDPGDLSAFKNAVKPSTKAFFIESFGNPNSDIPDIEGIAAIAHGEGIPLIIDNTFATPFLLRPAEYGADIIVHSATKFIGGHGTTIGGVVVDAGNFDWAASGKFPCLTQPNPSYHGISFTGKMGREAYIVKMRVTLLRDTGASMAP
ncbi:MAG: aminotransferase class I/II-fold pyridoxal phosphate-dependent enzyme, partial [Eubacteriales bacterium]|nr:aminotransferase class I/II-fold pyridoxal phosphate-dependent enzyme [Eubacteriales bacterium]